MESFNVKNVQVLLLFVINASQDLFVSSVIKLVQTTIDYQMIINRVQHPV